MNYNIKGTGLNVTNELRAYVEKRLGSLDKFTRADARADVELELDPLRDGPRYRAEFIQHQPGQEMLRAEAYGTTLHEAIDLAAAELFRKMTKEKKKRLQVFRRTAVRVKEYLRGWRRKV